MRAIDIRQNKVRYVGEIFENPEEMVRTIESREQVFGDRDSLNYTDGSGFTGYKNGEDFKRDFLASKAKASIVKDVEANLAKIRTQERKRVQFYNNVEGFAPIVPLAMMGVPESMRASRMVQSKSKVVTVVIDMSTSGYVSARDVAKTATELVGAVSAMEKQGYRVTLIAIESSCSIDETSFSAVKLKDASQPLNLSRIIYPFTTASFARRAGFAWYERKTGIHHQWGYGHPLHCHKDRKKPLADAISKGAVLIAVSDVIQGSVDVNQALMEAVA